MRQLLLVAIIGFTGLLIMYLTNFESQLISFFGGIFLMLFCIAFGWAIGVMEVETKFEKEMKKSDKTDG